MRVILLIVLGVVSIVLETSLLNYLAVFGAKPDILLLIIVFMAIFYGSKTGTYIGVIYGLMEDLVIGRYIGLNALVRAFTGYLIGLGEKKFYKDNLLVPFVALFLATVVNETLCLLLRSLVSARVEFPGGYYLLGQALYNSFLGLILYGKFYASATRGWLKGLNTK
ncbi:rod shape-determining protein MreD [Calderihabitans maritimus]|uniref:Uncharacterized protein n=1 Tax=Calderihabitans maritimus TaxID=1246530 RepID=A0A1Z5HVG6_9FIRM|nr:rod shape-determining protein MreD [Calderihabitans maritimus]GAW93321.1 hypothetical protein KKC1_24580 [Calderihabitans maritimus]